MEIKDSWQYAASALMNIAGAIVAAIVIYWILLKLTGHSPTEFQILMGMISIFFTLFAGFMVFCIREFLKMNRHMGKAERYFQQFDTLARDFKEFKFETIRQQEKANHKLDLLLQKAKIKM